mmetsp:Transcript_12513/g.23447  ORF Transcript_12513/g.23447 Transcript_12513/m.23447 type:complete len:319 (+) Transcript_12513:167-1123(+)
MKGYGTAGAGAVYYPKGFEEGEYIEAPVMKAVPLSRMEWSFMDYVAAFAVLVFPWVMFTGVYYVISFETHLKQPSLCWFLIGLAVFGVVAAIVGAFIEFNNKAGRQAIWATSMALSLSFALVIGMTVSESNYNSFMLPYYTWSSLNSYQNVDPGKLGGEAFMDAGKVTFSSNTALDLTKSAGFLNLDMFCVAPIVSSSGPSAREAYDFWAVGINCCSGVSSDFRCGEFNNPHARSGLRLMRDDQRPFFRLAVQQAEAAYNIKATHPLFFYWMQDPVAEMNSYRDDGFKYYLLGIFTHFAWNLFSVVCAVVGFSKIGRY